jgi:FkbM family methyltransferase
MIENIKNVEGWYMPALESSLLKKVKSTRLAYPQTPFLIDEYQSQLRNESIKYVKKHNVALDIGAHIGIWSVALSKVFNQVHAFEVNPDTTPCLNLNIESRNIKNVLVHPFGLGESNYGIQLIPTQNKSMATFVIPESIGNIPIKSLDSLNIKNIDLIKMDVEGYESFVLLGGKSTIKKYKPIIVTEDKNLHKKYGDIPSPSEILINFGMTLIKKYRKDSIYGWK